MKKNYNDWFSKWFSIGNLGFTHCCIEDIGVLDQFQT